jgi:hypothetical protein
MIYSTNYYSNVSEEKWELESGYKVLLVTVEGRRTTLTIRDEYGEVVYMRTYDWWQRSKAQSDADTLARFGSKVAA